MLALYPTYTLSLASVLSGTGMMNITSSDPSVPGHPLLVDLQGLQYSTPVAEYIAGNLSIVLDGVAAALKAYGLEFSITTSVPGQAYGSEISCTPSGTGCCSHLRW